MKDERQESVNAMYKVRWNVGLDLIKTKLICSCNAEKHMYFRV